MHLILGHLVLLHHGLLPGAWEQSLPQVNIDNKHKLFFTPTNVNLSEVIFETSCKHDKAYDLIVC